MILSCITSTCYNSTVSIQLFDTAGNPIVLQPFEQLVIDGLLCSVAAGEAYMLNQPASSTSTVVASTMLAVFTPANGLLQIPDGGLPLAAGVVPSILENTKNARIVVSGSGHIVNTRV